jgi:hypothetical protein
MATQVKKKQASKGVRLGWAPLKEVQSVKLTPDLVKGEKIAPNNSINQNSSGSYLIP